MTDSKWASRKFALACAAFVAAIPLLCAGLITSDQWISFNTWLVGLYFVANVSQKVGTNG